MRWMLLLIATSLLLAASCGEGENASTPMPDRPIAEVLADHASELIDIEGVNSVGQGACDGEPCISVGVVRLTPELRERIPERIEGYEVRVFEQDVVRPR